MNDPDTAALARLLTELAADDYYPGPWCTWFAGRAEDLRVELARRRIEAAIEHDPLGYYWFGRLT